MEKKFEYCMTDGEGTLIGYGVLHGFNQFQDYALFAYVKGYAIQAEPCADDCTTGE